MTKSALPESVGQLVQQLPGISTTAGQIAALEQLFGTLLLGDGGLGDIIASVLELGPSEPVADQLSVGAMVIVLARQTVATAHVALREAMAGGGKLRQSSEAAVVQVEAQLLAAELRLRDALLRCGAGVAVESVAAEVCRLGVNVARAVIDLEASLRSSEPLLRQATPQTSSLLTVQVNRLADSLRELPAEAAVAATERIVESLGVE